MVAKKAKRATKKVKTLPTKAMSAKKAKGVRGGSALSLGHEKWISGASFGQAGWIDRSLKTFQKV